VNRHLAAIHLFLLFVWQDRSTDIKTRAMSRFAFTIVSAAPLDRWLEERLPDVAPQRIATLVATGCLRINGQTCLDLDRSLQSGDRLKLRFPAAAVPWEAEALALAILYEDDDLIILNKSAGQVMHPAPGHRSGTLANGLLAHCPWPETQGRPGIVHRLDRDTSGAIVFAKTGLALGHLHQQFKTKTAQRHYLGLVEGQPTADRGTINQPIGPDVQNRHRYAPVAEANGGRSAITHWQVLHRDGGLNPTTLVEFRLETGRSHQIRVHCQFLGHPLVGDRLYGAKSLDNAQLNPPQPNPSQPGQHLHSWKLRLIHPRSGDGLETIAPLPDWAIRF
jgi:23S rRNA pseudouridine1911/1915/1917 synthase